MTQSRQNRVYLDSNIIMKYLLEDDVNIKLILEASKKKEIKTYISQLSFQEIATSSSFVQRISLNMNKITDFFRESGVEIYYDYDMNLVSGAVHIVSGHMTFTDAVHLIIAKKIGASYFITYDKDILIKENYEGIRIMEPSNFISNILRG